jgi:hypothetical protein
MEDNNLKADAQGSKEPFFSWTTELVAEVAKEVAEKYKTADLWSGDLTSEKYIVKDFIKRKKYEALMSSFDIVEAGAKILINREELNKLVKFFINCNDETI